MQLWDVLKSVTEMDCDSVALPQPSIAYACGFTIATVSLALASKWTGYGGRSSSDWPLGRCWRRPSGSTSAVRTCGWREKRAPASPDRPTQRPW